MTCFPFRGARFIPLSGWKRLCTGRSRDDKEDTEAYALSSILSGLVIIAARRTFNYFEGHIPEAVGAGDFEVAVTTVGPDSICRETMDESGRYVPGTGCGK